MFNMLVFFVTAVHGIADNLFFLFFCFLFFVLRDIYFVQTSNYFILSTTYIILPNTEL